MTEILAKHDARTHRTHMPKSSFAQYVEDELLYDFGVVVRAMFGGYGVSRDGLTFGLIVDDELYFKVDDQTVERYIKEGSRPFVYHKNGKAMKMNYYQVPPAVSEDFNQVLQWVDQALEVAARAKRKKK